MSSDSVFSDSSRAVRLDPALAGLEAEGAMNIVLGARRDDSEFVTVAALCRERGAERLVEKHYDRIERYFLRSFLPQDLAAELTQQTLVEAFLCRANFDPERGSERYWINGIAAHIRGHYFRAVEREAAAYARAALRYDDGGTFDEDAIERIDAERLEGRLARALSRLTPRERDVLTSYCWLELDYREIADTLGVSESDVRTLMYKARKKMRRTLTGNDTEPSPRKRRASGRKRRYGNE